MRKTLGTLSKFVGGLIVGVFLLVSCNFPLINQSDDIENDRQMTLIALQATSSALSALTNQTPDVGIASTPDAGITPEQISHQVTPFNPAGNRESGMTDPNTSPYANSQKAVAGENFSMGILERPFNAETMDKYFPDLDIVEGSLNRADPWIFLKIRLQGTQPDGTLSGAYGVEFDLNVDGRGDVLVFVSKPGADWSVTGVQVWKDANLSVGEKLPVQADQPQTGDGYETVVFNSGQGNDPDAAWARIDPNDPRSVQIAIKNTLINNDQAFMWGAWAQSEFHPEWFDYNDHFTIIEAGSPLTYQIPGYPLKALSEVDNTCRWAVGFNPTGSEPGVCPVPATPTVTASPGGVRGIAWNDYNGDRVKQAIEPGLSGASIRLSQGACGSGGAEIGVQVSGGDGRYVFNGLAPGSYCVSSAGSPGSFVYSGAGPITVNFASGGSATADFPYQVKLY